MRVLHLTSSFPRWEGDGSGRFVLDLAATSGLDAHVLAPHFPGSPSDETVDGVGVRRFRYAPDGLERLAYGGGLPANLRRLDRAPLLPLFLLAFRRAAAAEVRRLRPDVVHAHWWAPAGWVAAGLGVPFVVTMHGSDAHLARSGPARSLARRVLASAGTVGVVSQSLTAAWPGAEVLPMPVCLPVAGPWSPPPAPPIRLVAVGRNAPEKGFDVLLAALAHIRSTGTDFHLDLFGEGTQAIGGHGPVDRSTIAAALAQAHALVVPSRREGLGLVAAEAVLAGCPVIASDVGGLPEVVEAGVDGLLVAPGDPVALAAAIERLPLPAPIGRLVAHHDPAAVAARHRAVYERVSERRR
ncbi:MAG: glycosyltransferase family 4 protein [Acidobacteria bacterium]|nr:glycosyltransferase family 4 protein [Acidobacteriota bacterium]